MPERHGSAALLHPPSSLRHGSQECDHHMIESVLCARGNESNRQGLSTEITAALSKVEESSSPWNRKRPLVY